MSETLHVMTPALARQLQAEFAALLERHVCLDEPQTVYTKAEGAVPQPPAVEAPAAAQTPAAGPVAASATAKRARRAQPRQLQAQAGPDPF